MRISLTVMMRWPVLAGLLTGGLGAYPTYRLGGARALLAELAAWLIVLAAMAASGALTVRRAVRGPGAAAIAFVAGGAVRAGLLLGLGLGAWALGELPAVALLAWLAVFYVVMLLAEGIWLGKALMNAAPHQAPGETDRPTGRRGGGQ